VRRRRALSPLAAALLISLLVAFGVAGLRAGGFLEAAELAAYDWYLRLRPLAHSADPRILIVTMTERDIQELGTWPLPDYVLYAVLQILLRHEARAIGVDIYRDVPIPPGTDRLRRVLEADPRIVVVMKFGEGPTDGVRPPAAVTDPDRIGFNDVVVDRGGIVRRGLLFLDDGTNTFSSFALRLALLYLRAQGVAPEPDPRDAHLLRLGQTTIRPLETNDGAYVRADTRGYQFLLDFNAGDTAFASIDLGSLLTGKFDPRAVRDKVVLVGVTATSIKDNFYTPYSRGLHPDQDMPGVAIHGQIVSQLLRTALDGAAPMRSLLEWQAATWILVWSFAGGLLGLRARSPWWFGLATAGGLVTVGVVAFIAFLRGWWIPVVPPAATLIAAAALVTAHQSYREALQRSDLMKLFSRHVSREVAETIWREREEFLEGGRLRSQELVVTALFTDLSGFTPVAEKLSPEALMEWLNEYMDAMARRVSEHGGVVRQYAGDSIVVIFGVPVARRSEAEVAQDAVSAVECALAMADTLRALNDRWRREGRPTTGMRVGIFTGPAVAGSLGSAERSEYVVVGDTINTASRLESFDKELFAPDHESAPCRILIGETTLTVLGDGFVTEAVGEVSLKGKAHTVRVYRVIGRAAPSVSEHAANEARQ
jgi:adenylate cyclase